MGGPAPGVLTSSPSFGGPGQQPGQKSGQPAGGDLFGNPQQSTAQPFIQGVGLLAKGLRHGRRETILRDRR